MSISRAVRTRSMPHTNCEGEHVMQHLTLQVYLHPSALTLRYLSIKHKVQRILLKYTPALQLSAVRSANVNCRPPTGSFV